MKTLLMSCVVACATALAVVVPFQPALAQQGGGAGGSVTVENTRDVPVLVYLQRGEFDFRLGTVSAHSQATLPLPRNLREGEDVQVFVHPQGEMDLTTGDVQVHAGQNMKVLVPLNNAGFERKTPPEMIPNPGDGTTTVTVQNNQGQPVTLFLERGEFDLRLGTVPAHQEKTLTIPKNFTLEQESVELFVLPEKGYELASETFELKPDAHLFVRVPAS